MRSNTFDRLSFLSLFIVITLLPVFCLPFTDIPIETSKGLLLVFGLAACVIFWVIARLSDGKIILPRSWILVSGSGVALVFLLSAIFSKNSQISLFGTMLDTGSFWFIFVAFVLMFMSSIVFQDSRRAKIVLLGTMLSSVFILIFQFLHLFMPSILSLGILTDKTSNLLGSWNALGLFAGFSGLMFLLVLEFFPISKIGEILLKIFILLSLLFVAAVNFPLVWVLVGISALVVFVYKVSITLQKQKDEKEGVKKYFPVISFIVVMVSLLFFISGQFIGNIFPSRLQISNTEVGPSFGATMSVVKESLIKNPVFGLGPNRFEEAWSMHKPLVINSTPFWDFSFSSGFGLLPTLSATIGILGIIAWLVFLLLFLVIGVKSIFFSIKRGGNWEITAFFILSFYLFISSLFYFTGTVIFLMMFAFLGVAIGLVASSSKKEISISFLNDHRKSFFFILFFVVIIFFSAITTFKYAERFASMYYFNNALSANTALIAEENIGKALSLYSNDLYLRTYSQIYLTQLNSIINKGSSLSDADKANLQTSFDQAVSSAQMAVAYNPSNYLNHQSLGIVYKSAGSLGVKGAYEKSAQAFREASELNPLNPGLKLAIANMAFLDGKLEDAKDYANMALSLKSDYVDALIVLSQISRSEKDNAKALSYARAALSLFPSDKNLIQYVDSLNKLNSSSSAMPTAIPNKPKE